MIQTKKKFLQISLILGMSLGIQSALIAPSQAEVEQTEKSNADVRQSRVEEPKIQKFVFDFNNAYDYSACLDIILLAHERRNAELENVSKNDCATNILSTFGQNLSTETALQLVKSANLHATEGLEDPLYPAFGVRRRIAINLGYVYAQDKNNPDILKYINSES